MACNAHYSSSFAAEIAVEQWVLFKEHIYQTRLGLSGFREYLPTYRGKWTPDSGPIIAGLGAATTGLALKAARSVGDEETRKILRDSVGKVLAVCHICGSIPGTNIPTSIGTDLLASAIYSAL